MAKESNIVHRYFKKKSRDVTILLKVNPILSTGVEITLAQTNPVEIRQVEFDGKPDDLKSKGFEEASSLEFNLYYSGLAK